MPTVTPPSLTPTPTPAPQRNDRNTFSARFDAFITWFISACTEFPALATNVYNNALDAFTSATASSNYATNSSNSADAAAASAAAAAATTGVNKWLAATAYTQGNTAWSPLNFLTYRRSLAGTGTTAIDPSADPATWTLVTPRNPGSGGQSITTDTTLVTTSPANITVGAAVRSLYVTLPAANLCLTGTGLFTVTNNSKFDCGVRNANGTKLGWIPPSGSTVIGLNDASSAAGVWTFTSINKLGNTATFNSGSLTLSSPATLKVIPVDTNRTLNLISDANNLYGVVHDSSTNLFGSPVLIRTATGISAKFAGLFVAGNNVLVTSCDGTTGFQATVITMTGTSIGLNTAYSLTLAANGSNFGNLIAVNAGFVQAYSTTGSSLLAMTIAGTVVTIGAEVLQGTAAAVPPLVFVTGNTLRSICPISTVHSCTPYTLAGVVLTPGTSATTLAYGAQTQSRAYMNGNGNIVFMQNTSLTSVGVTVFKLTGTVEASSNLSTSLSIPSGTALTNCDLVPIGTNKALIVAQGGQNINANVITDSAGTASQGTTISTGILSASNFYSLVASAANGNAVSVLAVSGAASVRAGIDCSGASPVFSYVSKDVSSSGLTPTGGTSNNYCRRASGLQFVNGVTTQIDAGAGTAFGINFSDSAQRRVPISGVPAEFSTPHPSASNESWYLDRTQGTSLNRMELAA